MKFPLDKRPDACYNKNTKEKEIQTMAIQVTFYKRGRKPLKKTYKRYAPQLTVSYRQLVDMGYKVVKVEKVG